MFLAASEPAILMGDLNATAREPEIMRLQHMPGVTDENAAAAEPHRDTAGILSSGFRVAPPRLRAEVVADHPCSCAA